MNRIIQIRGSNCAGKTTAVKQFVERNNFRLLNANFYGIDLQMTWCEQRKIAIVGDYVNGTWGADRLRAYGEFKKAIVGSAERWHPKVVLFESYLGSKSYKFCTELRLLAESMGYDYRIMTFVVDFKTAWKRVCERSGGDKIKIDKFYQTWQNVLRGSQKLVEGGLPNEIINTANYPQKYMYKFIEKAIEAE